jgi:hypothetical protein
MEILNIIQDIVNHHTLTLVFCILEIQIKHSPSLLLSHELSSLFISAVIHCIRAKGFLSNSAGIFLGEMLIILQTLIVHEDSSTVYPPFLQHCFEGGLFEEFISLSSSSDPEIAAYSIMILLLLHYKREWEEREISISRLIELSPSVDSMSQEWIQDIFNEYVY